MATPNPNPYYRTDDAYVVSLQRTARRDGINVTRTVLIAAQSGLSRDDARALSKSIDGRGLDNNTWARVQRLRRSVSGVPMRGPGSRPAPPPGDKRQRLAEATYYAGGSRAKATQVLRDRTGKGIGGTTWTRVRREAAEKIGEKPPPKGQARKPNPRPGIPQPGRVGRGIGTLPDTPSPSAPSATPSAPRPPPESIFAGIPFNADGSVDFILRMRDKNGQEYAQTIRLERGGINNIAKAYRREAEGLAKIKDSPDLMDRFEFETADDWEFLPPIPI